MKSGVPQLEMAFTGMLRGRTGLQAAQLVAVVLDGGGCALSWLV